MKKLTCALLAGGKNSRMRGKNKAFLKIDNKSFFELAINVLDKIFDEILIITNSPEEFSFIKNKCEIVEDIYKNIGPLGGIYAALSHTSNDAVFFVPCDMPYLNSDFIKEQIQFFESKDCNALIPRNGNNIEPLHSVIKKSVLEKLHNFIIVNKNNKVRDFINEIDTCYFDWDDNVFDRKIFTNVNTIQEFEVLKSK